MSSQGAALRHYIFVLNHEHDEEDIATNMKHSENGVLILGHRYRHWCNTETLLSQNLMSLQISF